jgi:uncharacterized protein
MVIDSAARYLMYCLMMGHNWQALLLSLLTLGASDFANNASAQTAPARQSAYEARKREANENVVSILGGVGAQSSWTTLVQDMQNVLDGPQTPGGLRILAVQGRGGLQNAFDVLMLKGVDMAMIDQGDLQAAIKKEPKLQSSVNQRLNYIAKIANSDLQIIARADIKTIKDLDGKKVNCLTKASSTEVTCEAVFKILGVNVELTHLDQDQASMKLRAGEIAAFARYGPAPHQAFASFNGAEGYHFVPIDAGSISPKAFSALFASFSPALIRSESYPALVPADNPVPTVAGSLILVTYAWPPGSERYNSVAKFVRALFDSVGQFRAPSRHPSWKEVNLASDVAGWVRFQAAREWIEQHNKPSDTKKAAQTLKRLP